MTALDQYQRLEASGIWRRDNEAQRIDVIVAFGDATLTISTPQEVAISHWSLAAVRRTNPGERPALFSPGSASQELLEIDDATLIEAIEKVRKTVERHSPHPHRLRHIALSAFCVLSLLLAVFWLPGAIKDYTAQIVPDRKRAEIGAAALQEVFRLTGPACETSLARQSLADLSSRLLSQPSNRIFVLRQGALPSRHLPGGYILLNRSVVEDHEDPHIAAGYILAEEERRRAHDPLRELLDEVGLLGTIELLTTGDLSQNNIAHYAEAVLTKPPTENDKAQLVQMFAAHGVPKEPYAYAMDITGETTAWLINDPTSIEPRITLDDGAWVSLQSICGG